MSTYPAWFQISEEFPPRLFHTAESVPPGWRRMNKFYDTQTGQWIEGPAGKGEPFESVDPLDLPAISGFVRDGFDRDDPEGGNPKRVTATFERDDEVVAKDAPGGAEAATQVAAKVAAKAKRKRKARLSVSSPTRKGTEAMSVNENATGIAKPQPDKPVSKPQEDPVRRERGEDGTIRTGSAPTIR